MNLQASLLFVLPLWLVAPVSGAQEDAPVREDTRRIASSILTGDSLDLVRHLTDTIGARLAGSPEYERAARWAADHLRESGITVVRAEPYEIPNGWQRVSARGWILAPVTRELHIASAGWAPSTAGEGITSKLALLSNLDPAALKRANDGVRGRIVMVDTEQAIPAEDRMAFARLRNAFRPLKDAGVVAVLLPNAAANNVLGDWIDTANARGTVLPLPVAEIGLEDALLLRRQLKQGDVTLRIEIENRVTGPVQVENVIAEIRGREKPDEWVLVGAHLDSWDLGSGAQDNATGNVMVLEAARSIAMLTAPPRRSIRFALWAGEEPGIPGSAVYVRDHREDLKNCVAALNTDNGAGHPLGWKVARADVRNAMQPISQSFLEEWGGAGLSSVVDCGSDHCPFLLEGIPVLNLWVDTSQYAELHHKASDTFDKIDPLHLKANAAIVAVTAYLLAEREQPIAPHAAKADVLELLNSGGFDSDVVHALWRP
jgi:hypothetical protein